MKLKSTFIVFVVVLELCWCRYANIAKSRDPKYSLSTSKSNQEITVKIKIHFDNTLVRKLSSKYGNKTRTNLKGFAKKIVAETEDLFRHPSLNQKIKFVLTDTRYLRNVSKKIVVDENASKYLKSYCTWQSQKKVKDMYYSVLLTGLDLYYLTANGKKNWKSTGRGYEGAMCSKKHSCTLIEWNQNNVGFLLAHEIGHSLGIYHDGPPNKCNPKGNIMGAKYSPNAYIKTWSSCSQTALKKFLTTDYARCLKPSRNRNLYVY